MAAALTNDKTLRPAAAALAYLLTRQWRLDPADPHWLDRDRLFLAGSTAALGDALMHLAGATQPLHEHVTANPAHMLGIAVGAALAERLLAARFGRSLVDHACWLVGDAASLAHGAAREAASLAGSLKLDRLCVLVAADGAEETAFLFAALGWLVKRPDAGMVALASAVSAAQRGRRPSLILCADLTAPDAPPAVQPPPWGRAGSRAAVRRGWLKRLARHAQRPEFLASQDGRYAVPAAAGGATAGPCAPSTEAVLQLTALAAGLPDVAGMTADIPLGQAVMSGHSPGRTIPWHGQVQAMGAGLCGMAQHGGVVALSVLTLEDAEALRPAMRMAAVNGWRVVLGLIEPGVDCPSGGQRTAWRSLQGLTVFRPADAHETAECLALALRHVAGPSVLLLSAEAAILPPMDRRGACAGGAYVRREPAAGGSLRALTLIASGPELALALALGDELDALGLPTCVVSMPCWELFAGRDVQAQAAVLGHAPRFAIERGSGFGAERWLGAAGHFLAVPAGQDLADTATLREAILRGLAPKDAAGCDGGATLP